MNTSDFGSYEFIWMNTNTNITAQGMYIGAELIDDILIFYIINPAKKTVKAIKGYLLNHSISESINKDWFITFNHYSIKSFFKFFCCSISTYFISHI